MKYKTLLIPAVFLFLALAVYVFTDRVFAEESATTGKDLFRMNCAACHGVNLQGNPPMYPSLSDISGKLSRTAVDKQIQTGKNQMPSFAHLSEEQRKAIVDYLFEGKETTVEAAVGADKGRMLVKGNCLTCHRLKADDPRPAEACRMEPAHLAGAAERFSFESFRNIIDRGPCYMPSFSYLSIEDKESIYSYLKTVKDDSGETISRRHGVWRGGRGRHGMGRCGCR